MRRSLRRTFGVAFVLLGLTVGAVLVPALWSVTRASNWPSVEGIVLSSTVERSVSHEIDANDNRIEVERFEPHVTYRYTALGVTRVGHDFATFAIASVDEAWARAQQRRYRPGSRVTVYRSPDGTRAVLLPGLSARVWGWLALPALTLLLGAGLLWAGRAPLRPHARPGTRRP